MNTQIVELFVRLPDTLSKIFFIRLFGWAWLPDIDDLVLNPDSTKEIATLA